MAGECAGRSDSTVPRAALAGWILFDWAAQPFFSLVQTFGYAPYFVRVLAGDPVTGQALWGYGTAAAALLVAVISPPLGALADHVGRRKLWTGIAGAIYAACCLLLWFFRPGEPGAAFMALAAFCAATVAIEIAVVFNNAMLPGLVSRTRIGLMSGLGAAFGNVGGIVAIACVLSLLLAHPGTGKTLLGIQPILGLDGARQEGARAIGPFSALWFALFVLPLFFFTPDTRHPKADTFAIKASLSTLRQTLRELPHHPNLLRFLVANMIYTDGLVALLAFSGIFASGILGWSAVQIGLFGIVVTSAGVAGAFGGGALADRIGARTVVLTALAVLMAAILLLLNLAPDRIGPFAVEPPRPERPLFGSTAEHAYLAAGIFIGLCFGALLASTRVLLIQLSSPERLTQHFALFALSGRITSFLGPLSVAVATQLIGSQRAGLAVLIFFFGTGMGLLMTVRAPAGETPGARAGTPNPVA